MVVMSTEGVGLAGRCRYAQGLATLAVVASSCEVEEVW